MSDSEAENRCREVYDADATEDYAMQSYDSHEEQFAFVAGAKWQAGRDSTHHLDVQAVREALEAELKQPPYEGLDYRSGIRKALSLIPTHAGENSTATVAAAAAETAPLPSPAPAAVHASGVVEQGVRKLLTDYKGAVFDLGFHSGREHNHCPALGVKVTGIENAILAALPALSQQWLPPSALPSKFSEPETFMVLVENEEKEDVALQVAWFEGCLYPSHLGGNISWSDHIDTDTVKAWMPALPAALTMER